jgi:hypothetical protein
MAFIIAGFLSPLLAGIVQKTPVPALLYKHEQKTVLLKKSWALSLFLWGASPSMKKIRLLPAQYGVWQNEKPFTGMA